MNRVQDLVQVFGHGDAEVKIYPIRRKGTPYRFFQIAWYELGGRRTEAHYYRTSTGNETDLVLTLPGRDRFPISNEIEVIGLPALARLLQAS